MTTCAAIGCTERAEHRVWFSDPPEDRPYCAKHSAEKMKQEDAYKKTVI